ncbi:hypothetical protein AMAG_06635 [Allomyces macrogynus ATCC 38327]|uniref:Major facilitator superfamily (MFS) profile domain-containing protein n=1 Tax=Allomyces macrogynus (strain ATCC 38327) TaxID=578462 RepID=A0A0L0SEK9_ALLM3|nr:hypothetical protein AMAG_06635 [Allomyces macrogynus ATCC 38327]|eukprot:KNE60874.1 hypothetical protein AMAG_06635 [Allomyces macrogynus ATCC 38327]
MTAASKPSSSSEEFPPPTQHPAPVPLPLRSRPWIIAVLVTLIAFVDFFIYAAVIPILPTIVQDEFGLGPAYTGYLVGAFAGGLLVATPIFGLVSDRLHDRKWPIVISLTGLTAASLLFLICSKYWHYVSVRILQGIAAAGNWTVSLALISDVFPANQLGATMGTVMAGISAGGLLGPAVGGGLYGALGPHSPYYLFTGLSVFALVLRLVVDEHPAIAAKEKVRAAAMDATTAKSENTVPPLLVLVREPAVWVNCLAVIFEGAAMAGLEPVLPPWLTANFGTSVSENGFMFLALGLPELFVGPLTGWLCDRHSPHVIMILGLASTAIALPMLPLPATLPVCIAVYILVGIVLPVAMIPTLPDMGNMVARKYSAASGQVYACFNVAYALSMFIGPIVSSLLYEAGGLMASMGLFSGVTVCVMLLYIWYYRKYHWRSSRTETSPPAASCGPAQSDTVIA